jgi:hypothetical protein
MPCHITQPRPPWVPCLSVCLSHPTDGQPLHLPRGQLPRPVRLRRPVAADSAQEVREADGRQDLGEAALGRTDRQTGGARGAAAGRPARRRVGQLVREAAARRHDRPLRQEHRLPGRADGQTDGRWALGRQLPFGPPSGRQTDRHTDRQTDGRCSWHVLGMQPREAAFIIHLAELAAPLGGPPCRLLALQPNCLPLNWRRTQRK